MTPIDGEPGIGKTRLVSELGHRARALRGTLLVTSPPGTVVTAEPPCAS